MALQEVTTNPAPNMGMCAVWSPVHHSATVHSLQWKEGSLKNKLQIFMKLRGPFSRCISLFQQCNMLLTMTLNNINYKLCVSYWP